MGKEELEALLGRIDVWLLVFGVIVVIGVAGESFFGVRHWRNSRKLQALLHIEEQQRAGVIAEANRDAAGARKDAAQAIERAAKAEESLGKSNENAAQANERAARAEAQIAEANERAAQAMKDAAEANRKAEEERLARVKIEQQLAPRNIDVPRLTAVLKKYPVQRVDMFVYGGDSPEIRRVTSQLETAFASARWTSRTWTTMGGGAVSGILVSTRSGFERDVEKAANGIIAALHDQGIAVAKWQQFEGTNLPSATIGGPDWEADKIAPIRIMIGAKP